MKQKKYENYFLYLIIVIVITIIELLLIFYIFNKRIYKYTLLTGIVENKELLLVVNKNERSILYQNSVLYLDDQKKKYKIISDQKNNDYYQIIIKLKINKQYKDNDIIKLNFKEKKYRIARIIKDIIGGV